MNPDHEKRIEELEREIQSLKSFTTIPFDVDKAFRARLGIDNLSSVRESVKVVASENVAAITNIDFGTQSTETNTVLDNPDIFLEVTVNGTVYYLPAFTS